MQWLRSPVTDFCLRVPYSASAWQWRSQVPGWETRNPRSNDEDAIAWSIWATGMFLVGVGVSLPFARPTRAVLISAGFPVIGSWLLSCAYWMARSETVGPPRNKWFLQDIK